MENELLPSFEKLEHLTDREITIVIVSALRTVITNQTNHLRHHWAVTLVCAAAALSGVFNLGIAFLIIFFRAG